MADEYKYLATTGYERTVVTWGKGKADLLEVKAGNMHAMAPFATARDERTWCARARPRAALTVASFSKIKCANAVTQGAATAAHAWPRTLALARPSAALAPRLRYFPPPPRSLGCLIAPNVRAHQHIKHYIAG